VILYLETNGILELALRQERVADTERLVELAKAGNIALAVPAIALAESYYPLRERMQWFEQYQRMTQEAVSAMGRSQAEAYTKIAAAGSEVETQLVAILTQERGSLEQSILSLIDLAESIPLSADIIQSSINLSAAIGLTEFDAMICASVINHANGEPDARKAFLSYDEDLLRNGRRELRHAGIDLFSDAEQCLAYAQRFAAE